MIRASSPSEQSFLAQWCALELASIATMHPAGNCEHQAMNLSLASARPVISRPEASTACTWITRLARSTPTRTTTPPHSPRVICSTDFPLQWLEIDDFEHHQSWRYDAVAEGGKSLRIHRADVLRQASLACGHRSCQTTRASLRGQAIAGDDVSRRDTSGKGSGHRAECKRAQ